MMNYTLLDVTINPIHDIWVTMINHWWIPALMLVGLAVIIGLIILFIKRNKNEKDEES